MLRFRVLPERFSVLGLGQHDRWPKGTFAPPLQTPAGRVGKRASRPRCHRGAHDAGLTVRPLPRFVYRGIPDAVTPGP